MTIKKAIKRFQGWLGEGHHKINDQTTDWRGDKEALELAIQCMKDKRLQGEWGKWIISEIQCPNCFRYFETDYYSKEELKNCPNCGADMWGGEQENEQ